MIVIGCVIAAGCQNGPSGASASESASAGDASSSMGPLGGVSTGTTAGSAGETASGGAPGDGGGTDSEGGTGSVLPTGGASGDSQGGETTTTTTTTTTAATTNGVTATSGDSGDSGDSADSADGGSTAADVGECVPLACDGKIYDCGDCMDNDGDGLVDQADPECVSPCDDREDVFATGVPGDNNDPCKQDCFFDGNSGQGGGDCQWNLKCDEKGPGSNECPYDPEWVELGKCPEEQGEACLLACQAPNGCDCFGCCTVVVDGEETDIFLGDDDCSLKDIDSCAACTKNEDCFNDCDPEQCEVCFPNGGELPPGCEEATCPAGVQPCKQDNEGGSNCPEGEFCSTGCCFKIEPG